VAGGTTTAGIIGAVPVPAVAATGIAGVAGLVGVVAGVVVVVLFLGMSVSSYFLKQSSRAQTMCSTQRNCAANL